MEEQKELVEEEEEEEEGEEEYTLRLFFLNPVSPKNIYLSRHHNHNRLIVTAAFIDPSDLRPW